MTQRLEWEVKLALIREVQEIRDRCVTILEILVPPEDPAQCPHPGDRIADESTMGEPKFVCQMCGEVRAVPFTVVAG